MKRHIAIIDLGTSSTKMCIAKITDGEYDIIHTQKEESNLGEDLKRGNDMIGRASVDRNIRILNSLRETAGKYRADIPLIVATEGLRKAANSDNVIGEINAETGLDIVVIPQQRESELFWLGATHDFQYDPNAPIVAFDIGGGSVQIMYGTKNGISSQYMFQTGVVFLEDKFIQHDPPRQIELQKLTTFIEGQISNIRLTAEKTTPFIHGSSSILDLYKEAKFNLDIFDYSRSHPLQSPLHETRRKFDELTKIPFEKRKKFFPSQPFFMKSAFIGMAYILAIGDMLGLTYELPSNKSVIDGVLTLAIQDRLEELV